MSNGKLVITNKPSAIRAWSARISLLLFALIICFLFSSFAADPVNAFLQRHDHKQMVWTLFGITSVLACIFVGSRSTQKGPYHVIEFDASGFASTIGAQKQRVPWIDIIDTHYDESRSNGFFNFAPPKQLFRLYLRDGSGLLLRGFDSAQMDTLIAQINQPTKHLLFAWVKPQPETAGRDTLTGRIIKIEERGDAVRRKPARVLMRVESALYGKQSDFPNPLAVYWEFWWQNAAQLPPVGDKISVCGYFSQSTDMFFAGAAGNNRSYEKRLRSDV